MFRFSTVFFCIVLILNKNQLDVSAKKDLMSYDIQDAIEDINLFIPGSKAILTTAIKIWLVFGQVEQLVNPNSTHIQNSLDAIQGALTEVEDKLDSISDNLYDIKDDIKELSDIFQEMASKNIPQEQSLMRILSLFHTNIGLVDSQFNHFLHYNNHKKRNYANDTLLNYANKIVDHGLSELPAVMDKVYGILTAKPLGKSSLDMLADSRLSSAMMCNREMSAQHKISVLYNEMTMAEIKNILMVEFAYSLKKIFNTENDYATELEEAREKSFLRSSKMIKSVKKAMTSASRDFWRCDPPKHIESETYVKLGPIFQAYVAKEKDLYDDDTKVNTCKGPCNSRIKSKDACESGYCKTKEDVCDGFIHDCSSVDATLYVCFRGLHEYHVVPHGMPRQNLTRFPCGSHMDPARLSYDYHLIPKWLSHGNHDDRSAANRYKYIYGDDLVYGKKETCSSNEVKASTTRQLITHKCDICMCTCAVDNPNLNRYFNLRSVASDVNNNKVVTGVRLQLENQIFHIQIKEGTLLKNGNVNGSSNEWKPIESFSVNDDNVKVGQDYHKITYENRTIHLDNIDSPINNVVTGLRFKHQNDYVKLEIKITPFDFDTGKLDIAKSTWKSNPDDTQSRHEKDLRNLDLPTTTTVNKPDSNNNEYFKFTTSSLKSDIGQNVVPFIDIQPLETEPPVPISGVALIHKGDEKSAGFMAFKLSTYNYAPHLQ